MLSMSTAEMTARSSTLVNRAILRRSVSGTSRLERHNKMSGCTPMERSALTECWVGLVLISPTDGMKGTRVK